MSRSRRHARDAVYRAIQRGDLVRPDVCGRCGEAGWIDAHHEDYDKPLEVDWVCRRCHGAHHAAESLTARRRAATHVLRAAGWTHPQIAEVLDVTRPQIYKYLDYEETSQEQAA